MISAPDELKFLVALNGTTLSDSASSSFSSVIPVGSNLVNIVAQDGSGRDLSTSVNLDSNKRNTYFLELVRGDLALLLATKTDLQLPEPEPVEANTQSRAASSENIQLNDVSVDFVDDMSPLAVEQPQFSTLKQDLKEAEFESERLEKSLSYVKQYPLTVNQLIIILKKLEYEDHRLAAVKAAYDQLIDPENADLVSEVLSMNKSKTDFREFLKSKGK